MSDLTLSVSSSTNVLTSVVGADEINLTLSESTNVVTKVVSPENTLSIDLVGSVTPTSLAELTDVKVSDITDGQTLVFDTSSGAFTPSTPSSSRSDSSVQSVVGAMFTSNTDTRIASTYDSSSQKINLVVTDMTADTQLSTEQVQDIVGDMFSGNTETRISATYQDGDGNIDLVVDAIPVDLTSDGAGTIHANNVPTLNQSTTGNAATVTTNANLTGHITSTGNAAVLGSFSVAQLSAALSDASISGNNTGDQTTVSGSSGSCTGNAATATALATARAINGVNFDGTAPITVTAAGSTLSDTVTVAKGGTGATSLTSDSVLTGAGTSAVVAEANLTFDGSILTVTGQRKIPTPSSTDQYYGDVVAFGSGPNGADADIEAGKLYYLDSSQQWEQTNANAAASATGMIAIAVVDDNARFLVKGLARHGSWAGFTTGDVLYVSGTAGEITNTAPTGSADIVRIVGYCTNSGQREIYFDPSKDWVELS